MTGNKLGDIVLLEFPFTDTSESKKRPALVICDLKDGDLIVCRVTGRSLGSKYKILIDKWKAAGLLINSYVKLHKIATLEKTLVNRKLGQLANSNLEKLKKKFVTVIEEITQTA